MSIFKQSGQMILSDTKSKLISSQNNTKEKEDSESKFKQILETNEALDEANKILKERGKHKGVLAMKPKSKRDYIDDCKLIRLKNYQIRLLNEERNGLNDQEHAISKAIIDNEVNLDKDFKRFQDFINEEKNLAKTNEQKYLELLENNQKLKLQRDGLANDNKNINEELERLSKLIANQQNYARFVNSVLGGARMGLRRETIRADGGESVDHLINEFANIIQNDVLEVLEDAPKLLKSKFTDLEEKILKLLEKNLEIDKDLKIMTDDNNRQKVMMNDKEEDIKLELKNLNEAWVKESKNINLLKDQMCCENDNKTILYYILDLYKECFDLDVNDMKYKQFKKKIEQERSENSIKDFVEVLRSKEHQIGKYLAELEYMESKNEKVFNDVLERLQQSNKLENLSRQKEAKDKLMEDKRRKAEERASRNVIKGRQLLPHNLVNKDRHRDNNMIKDKADNDDYYLQYND